MICPACQYKEDKVIDSRPVHDGRSIRRRRECLKCSHRFTTYENIEAPIHVIKRDGSRENFSREKLMTGLRISCQKRPVSLGDLLNIVTTIQTDFEKECLREVKSMDIGNKVMELLRHLDQVAYVRFASVYRQFKDVDEFMNAARLLKTDGQKSEQ